MAKHIVLMPRRPDISRAAFLKHYEAGHAPLAMALLSFAKYRRNHVSEVDGGQVDFDCLTEIYDSTVVITEDMARQIAEDENRFADRSRVRTATAEEIPLMGDRAAIDRPGTKRRILLLERGGGVSKTQMLDAAYAWVRQFGEGQVRRATLDFAAPHKTVHNNSSVFPGDTMLSFWPGDALPATPPVPGGLRLLASLTAIVYETPPRPA